MSNLASPPSQFSVLVLWADDLSTNLGVQALSAGTIEFVRASFGADTRVTCLDHNWQRVGVPLGKAEVIRALVTGRGTLVEWLRQFDYIVDSGAGDSLTDIYGVRRLFKIAAIQSLVARNPRARLILGPQTIGPFGTRLGKILAKWGTRKAIQIFARDSLSVDYCLEQLGKTAVWATDVVFLLPQPCHVKPSLDVVLNVSGLLWRPNHHIDNTNYRRRTMNLVDNLVAAGRRIVLLPHVLDSISPDNDMPAVEAVAAQADLPILIPRDLDEARAILASARIVVGARMHACLNALSVGTPAIPWAYSRKFKPLLHDLDWGYTIDLNTSECPEEATAILVKQFRDVSPEEHLVRVRDRAVQRLHAAIDSVKNNLG